MPVKLVTDTHSLDFNPIDNISTPSLSDFKKLLLINNFNEIVSFLFIDFREREGVRERETSM